MSTVSTKITEKMIIDEAGKDIVLNGLDFTKNGYLEIKNANSVVVKNCRVYKMNCEDATKNYWMKVIGDIPVKLAVLNSFFGNNPGTNGHMYNLFEMNAKLKSNSMISSNWFTGDCCTHNTINIYGAEENAAIYVNNNYFADSRHSIRVGIKEAPVCSIVAQGNELQITDTTPEELEWSNFMLFQPYGKKTTTFGNLKVVTANNKMSQPGSDPIVAYFGSADMPMSYESAPKVTVDGKEFKIPIRVGSTAVAVVGTTVYETLAAAIEAAGDNEITLVNSTEEEVDTSAAKIVASRPGLTIHGVELEF